MFETQFILQNFHFILNIIAAFIFFCVAWLYFDAWLFKKTLRDGLKILGFGLISVSFLIHSTVIEQALLKSPFLGPNVLYNTGLFIELIGFIMIASSLLIEGVQKVPRFADIKTVLSHSFLFAPSAVASVPPLLSSVLAALVGYLYLRRGTVGLENHLKPVSLSFFLLSISCLLSSARAFQNSANLTVFDLSSAFGSFWIFEHLFLLLTILIMARWVFQYLLKRMQTQIFIISEIFILIIFLFTTMMFTSFLFKNMQNNQLEHLKTDVNVLSYAVDSKKAETLSDAQMTSQNPEVIRSISGGDRQALRRIMESILLSKRQAFLIALNNSGQVLMRADDPENSSSSMSEDSLFKRAISGESLSTVTVRDGVLAPVISIRSASPVYNGKEAIGAVIVGSNIDNAFVDGVKRATGLESSVYGENMRSATTFLAPDGKSRWVGIKEENPLIMRKVLEEGETYIGSTDILNASYLAAYAPLKDADNVPVGILFAGKDQAFVLQTAAYSIQLTFIISAVLLIFSIIPVYLFAKFLTRQI